MSEVRLGRLRVVKGTVANGPPGGAEGQRAAVEEVAAPVAVLGRLVHDLQGNNGQRRKNARRSMRFFVRPRGGVTGMTGFEVGFGRFPIYPSLA